MILGNKNINSKNMKKIIIGIITLLIIIGGYSIYSKIMFNIEYKDYSEELKPFLIRYGNIAQNVLEKKARSTRENLRPFLTKEEEIELLKKTGCKNVEVLEYKKPYNYNSEKKVSGKCSDKSDFGDWKEFRFLCLDNNVILDVQDYCGDVKQVGVWKKVRDFHEHSYCDALFYNFTFNINSKQYGVDNKIHCFVNFPKGWGKQ